MSMTSETTGTITTDEIEGVLICDLALELVKVAALLVERTLTDATLERAVEMTWRAYGRASDLVDGKVQAEPES